MTNSTRLRGSCPAHPLYRAGCPDCRAHAAARGRHRTRLVAYGQWRGMTDTAEACNHLAQLLDGGMSQRAVAEASGVARAVVSRLANRDLPLARADTVAAILGTKLRIPPYAWVSSLGTARRLQALMTIGWDAATLAERLGLTPYRVASWRWHKEARIRNCHHEAVAALFRELSAREGPNDMARRQAKHLGYARPANWDDDGDFEDPKAKPKGVKRRRAA